MYEAIRKQAVPSGFVVDELHRQGLDMDAADVHQVTVDKSVSDAHGLGYSSLNFHVEVVQGATG